MTSFKSVSWSALVNVGNNESLALTVSGEAANPDEARDIFAFAIGQLIGVANSADEVTAPLIRAYVSRLVQTEEARPVEQDAPAPVPKKEPWAPKITKASYDARQANAAAKQDTVPATPPSAEEQAAAAVAQCIKPPTGDCTRSRAECTTDPRGLRVRCTTIRRGLCELWCGRVCEPGEALAVVHEQNALQIVHGGDGVILIFATPEEARELLGLSTRQPEILRPQTSGPCVHYDERSEHAADAYPCTYPYGDGTCPHGVCPVMPSTTVPLRERSEHVNLPDVKARTCYATAREVLAWVGDDTPAARSGGVGHRLPR
jgi:hypothetical protein